MLSLELLFAGAAGAFALGILSGPTSLDFQHSPSPGLANLVAFVAVLSAWYLLLAVVDAFGNEAVGSDDFRKPFDSRLGRTAIDVLAVLGGAAAIVYVAHQLA